MSPGAEKLREEVTRLKALLDDPQPGLYTWVLAVSRHWRNISDWWANGIPQDPPTTANPPAPGTSQPSA